MNQRLINRIVDAVLYEGYILYPYRPSVKNRQRWTFGGLYPEAYCRAQKGSDAATNQTECLVEGSPDSALDVSVRFLHLTDRTVGAIEPPLAEWDRSTEAAFRPVPVLRVGQQAYFSWQEAEEREIHLHPVAVRALLAGPVQRAFACTGRRWLEPIRGAPGAVAGVLVREQQTLTGVIEMAATPVAENLFRITVRVMNSTPLEEALVPVRDAALLRTLVSTHTILGVRGGEFVSLLDPPEPWREAAAACRNVGTWPVLVGDAEVRDTLLSSPIILYDYPQVAPESPGNLFDGSEIDEILTLRILTLTNEEKQAAAAVDDRARDLLARTESLAREQMLGLHGTMRNPEPLAEECADG